MSELNNDSAYILVVSCNLDNEQQEFMFDYVSDTDTRLISDITTHPMVNGDIVADHMFKNPLSFNVSGIFSLYGNKRTAFGHNRLESIQTTFERIKNEAILCNISIQTANGQEGTRFKSRKNMVLSAITWREKQASIDFSFTFNEILFVELTPQEYAKNINDEYLPSLSSPTELNFTDVLIDFNDVDAYLIDELTKAGLIGEGFLDKAINMAANFGKDIGILTEEGYSVIKRLSSITSTAIRSTKSYIKPGLIALFGIKLSLLSPVFHVLTLYAYGKAKKQYSQNQLITEQFKLYNDDKKNRAEVTRFANFVGTIHKALATFNNYIKIYAFSSDQEQECSMYIDNNFYTFTIKLNTLNNTHIMNASVLTEYGEETIVTNAVLEECAKTSFISCNETNYLFRTNETSKFVYVVNLQASELQENISEEEYKEIVNKVFNYAILVSDINPKDYNEVLTKVLSNALTI